MPANVCGIMFRTMKNDHRQIILAFPMAFQEGLDKYNGVMRYVNERRPNWRLRLDRLANAWDRPSRAELPGLDGAIVDGGATRGLLQAYASAGIPLVAIDWRHPDLGTGRKAFVRIAADDTAIGRAAAQTLHETVPTSYLAFIAPDDDLTWCRDRARAFAVAARRWKIPVSVLTLSPPTELRRQLRQLTKPAAIFAANDNAAAKVLTAANDEDIPVPTDLSVLGVDNEQFTCLHTEPPLASIQPDFEQAGYLAAAALDRLLSGQRVRNLQCYSIKEVVLRKSLEPSGTAGKLVQRALSLVRDDPGIESVGDLAKTLGVSRRLLDLRFRQIRSQTVLDAINDRRLSEVCRLLRTTATPIGEICASSRLGSGTYPMRLFKKTFGMTMRKYRERRSS